MRLGSWLRGHGWAVCIGGCDQGEEENVEREEKGT